MLVEAAASGPVNDVVLSEDVDRVAGEPERPPAAATANVVTMLSASAYSFRQKSRLAISLSWVGGFTNIVAFMACGQFVSHVTGTTSMIAHDLVTGDYKGMLFAGFVWISFLCGAALSATMTETAKRHGVASKYIPPIVVEALLLIFFGFAIHVDSQFSLSGLYLTAGLAAVAMGIQNATITKISGAVIRTTHVTGVTTDLGLEGVAYLLWLWDRLRGRRWERAGRVLRVSQRHPSLLRVALLASIFGSFLFGAVIGAFSYLKLHEMAVALPVAFLSFIIFIDWRKPIADVRELDLLGDPELKLLGILKPLLPPELHIWRAAARNNRMMHRAPDFETWAERLPPHWRVIILALSPLIRFDANAVLDLKAAIALMDREGRRLILSGITPGQYRLLMDAEIEKVMDVENICPDLEFAIARGIDLVHQGEPDEEVTADAS
jgi:uncharacterized membrane protein YoaK (UPF0700 family)